MGLSPPTLPLSNLATFSTCPGSLCLVLRFLHRKYLFGMNTSNDSEIPETLYSPVFQSIP